ncbi:stage II sporulation protein R [Natranaerovirga pectinivora]|uniref:Stage II sporulation protein R n=1 Tax=Natranaerovirga pectinivora TaxID=682400 RepID=A0A4V2V047_9FIRM|nr:stage II sporulation protein R [Natranaerovirga pectinivora]TCT13961.1 stage II sporulation protein R [Natranaerovirga pectinivora]
MNKKILREGIIITIALSLGLLSTFLISIAREKPAGEVQQALASQIIRFHVLANSDTAEDQALKNKVRDAVLEDMEEILSATENIEETRSIINDNLDRIKAVSENIIKENDKAYKVNVKLENALFPTRAYSDMILPTGEYEALRIEIGEAKGQNWWCVMFPPLCFVDSTHSFIPENTQKTLQNVLTEEEYKGILQAQKEEDIPLVVRFKILDVVNDTTARQKEKNTGIMAKLFGRPFMSR